MLKMPMSQVPFCCRLSKTCSLPLSMTRSAGMPSWSTAMTAVFFRQRQVAGVKVGQVDAEEQRRAGQRPQRQLRLPLRSGEPVVAAVADLGGVVVVPAAVARVRLPAGGGVEPGRDVVPVGERVAAAVRSAVALDVAAGAPAVGERRPGGAVVDVQAVGQLKQDGATALVQRRRPGLNVRRVGRADAVQLQVVHAPGGELVRPGVDEGLRAGLAEVDALHAAAVVVVLAVAVGDLVGGVGGARDRRFVRDGLVGDPGCHVDAELQAQAVHVVGDDLDAVGRAAGRERARVGHPAPVGIDVRALAAGAVVPEVIQVDVVVAVRVQAAGHQRLSLGLDVRRGRVVPQEAPAAPAHRRGIGDQPVVLGQRPRRRRQGCQPQARGDDERSCQRCPS